MNRLIVLVPGIAGGIEGWQDLIDRLNTEAALEGSHWVLWNHHKTVLSRASANALAITLRARIDQEWAARGPFDDLILVGHSLGGLLVREAYLLACGCDYALRQRSDWASRVSRIILFAAVNRGVDPRRSVSLRFASWLGRAVPAFREVLSWQLLRGSEFITNLRIQWIRQFAELAEKAPVVVQLLGTRDELVTRDDSVDVEQFQNGFYIQVPDATHGNLFRLDCAEDPSGRYAIIRDAFVHERPKNAENITITGPDKVVFVLHGIRADNRTWVQETIDTIKSRWPDVEAIGPQYPFVSALKFAIPMTRRRSLRWFQDAYSQALARNPRARFSFIGHSNGTYLLGESLRSIPGMQFDQAALIGSVLPADYDWDERVRRQQIQSIRVDGSCYDWPVGWLCSALRGIGMKDVGTGGFRGFTTFVSPNKREFFWYVGGHSAPLKTDNLEALAQYAVTGTVLEPAELGHEVKWFSVASRAARVVAPLALLAVVALLGYLAFVRPLAAVLIALAALVAIFVLDIV